MSATGQAAPAEAAIWQDVECGGYGADLPLWRELAAAAPGSVLELGCGTGRVSLDLARAGFELVGLDRDPELLVELRRRAAGLALEAVRADAREFALARRFGLIVAPMQLAHLLGGPTARAAMLTCVAAHLLPGGKLACALLGDYLTAPADGPPPLPDVREVGSWVYSSLPVEVRAVAGGLELVRLRQAVSPAGELRSQTDVTRLDPVPPAELEQQARAAGLVPAERRAVPPTDDHVGSVVVIAEAPR